MKTILLWIGFAGCIVGGAALQGIHAGVFLQPTAALIVLLPVLLYLLYSLGGDLPGLLSRACQQKLTESDLATLDTAVSLGFVFGVIGMVTGMIATMANLSDSAQLGAGIALSFVSAIYGALPAVLLLPVRAGANPTSKGGVAAGAFMAFTAVMLAANVMTVVYALGR